MKRTLWIALLFISLIAFVFAAAFTFLQPVEPTDLVAVLAWLAAGPGAVWVAGRALSFLLEEIPAWGTALSGTLRWWIVLVLAVGIMVGAYALLQRSDFLPQLDPIYKMAFLLIAAWLGTKQQFTAIKAAGLLKRPE